jgi:hypothetical protein
MEEICLWCTVPVDLRGDHFTVAGRDCDYVAHTGCVVPLAMLRSMPRRAARLLHFQFEHKPEKRKVFVQIP